MLQIRITSKRDFIKQLFLTDTFDSFLLEEATIKNRNTYMIDGRNNKDFYSALELQAEPTLTEDFTPWSIHKPLCFDLIKGKKTPLYFKFVLHLAKNEIITESDIKAFVLTIKFDGETVLLTTGISLRTFQLDKTPEQLWDSYIQKILSNANINYELTL